MQVTHSEDFVSHAILGGQQSIDMGIDDSPEFFQILSSTLYSDQILAVVREVICNAWDAHIDAGCTDKPVEIVMDTQNMLLTIKDSGLGIPHDEIGTVYGVYGKSTKKNDKRSTGGFGLGCKSPFAYTDNFEVTSCNGGKKVIYRMSKSAPENGGRPAIVPMVAIPTEETGITVKIDIKDRADMSRFELLIKRIVRNGEIFATYQGQELERYDFKKAKHGYAITKDTLFDSHYTIAVRYGNVIYPLTNNDAYSAEFAAARRTIDKLPHGYTIILFAEPDTISITPSRETLSLQEKTVKTLKELLVKFSSQINNDTFNVTAAERMVTAQSKRLKTVVEENTGDDNVYRAIREAMTETNGRLNGVFQTVPCIFNRDQYVMSALADGDNQITTSEVRMRERRKRIGALLQPGIIEKFPFPELLRSYWKMLMKTSVRELEKANCRRITHRSETWFTKNCVAPVSSGMKAAGLEKHRLLVAHRKRSRWAYSTYVDSGDIEFFPACSFFRENPAEYVWYTRNIVVLTHSIKTLTDRLDHVDEWDITAHFGRVGDFMVYHCSRGKKATEAAREYLSNLKGITFIDTTLYQEEFVHENGYRSYERKAARKGWPALVSARRGGMFDVQETKGDDVAMVEKPEAYTFLNSRSSYGSQGCLPDFGRETSVNINHLWGDRIAVLYNERQTDKVKRAGAIALDKWVQDQLVYEFMNNMNIQNFLRNSITRAVQLIPHDLKEDTLSKARLLLKLEDVFPDYEQVELSKDEKLMLSMFREWVTGDKYFRNEGSSAALRYQRAKFLYDNLPVNPLLLKAINIAETNFGLNLLNIPHCNELLKEGGEEEKKRAIQLIKHAIGWQEKP